MKVVSVIKFQARGKLLGEFLNDQSWEKSSYFHNYFSQRVSTILVTYTGNSFFGEIIDIEDHWDIHMQRAG